MSDVPEQEVIQSDPEILGSCTPWVNITVSGCRTADKECLEGRR